MRVQIFVTYVMYFNYNFCNSGRGVITLESKKNSAIENNAKMFHKRNCGPIGYDCEYFSTMNSSVRRSVATPKLFQQNSLKNRTSDYSILKKNFLSHRKQSKHSG